jgi:hypothetical protein
MPYKKSWSSTTAKPPAPLDRPVWVDLEAFWGRLVTASLAIPILCPAVSWSPRAVSLDY